MSKNAARKGKDGWEKSLCGERFFPLLEIIKNLPRLSVKIKQLREGFPFFGEKFHYFFLGQSRQQKFNILSHLHD